MSLIIYLDESSYFHYEFSREPKVSLVIQYSFNFIKPNWLQARLHLRQQGVVNFILTGSNKIRGGSPAVVNTQLLTYWITYANEKLCRWNRISKNLETRQQK